MPSRRPRAIRRPDTDRRAYFQDPEGSGTACGARSFGIMGASSACGTRSFRDHGRVVGLGGRVGLLGLRLRVVSCVDGPFKVAKDLQSAGSVPGPGPPHPVTRPPAAAAPPGPGPANPRKTGETPRDTRQPRCGGSSRHISSPRHTEESPNFGTLTGDSKSRSWESAVPRAPLRAVPQCSCNRGDAHAGCGTGVSSGMRSRWTLVRAQPALGPRGTFPGTLRKRREALRAGCWRGRPSAGGLR